MIDECPCVPYYCSEHKTYHTSADPYRGKRVEFKDITHPGISLRQWYAGMALQGLLANPDVKPTFKADVITEERATAVSSSYAQIALRLADALLAEEEKG